MLQRKEVDLELLLSLHQFLELSDSKLARHFRVDRNVIKRRRAELGLQSNKAKHRRSGATDRIYYYIESRGGVVAWQELVEKFGGQTHAIFISDKFGRLLRHRQEIALVHIKGYEPQAQARFEEWQTEREKRDREKEHIEIILRKRAEPQYDFVTLKELTYAIMIAEQLKSGRFVKLKQAEETAMYVLSFFGFNERIIDNVLKRGENVKDRDLFYHLEDLGILKTAREEIDLCDGGEWRIFYWDLKKDIVLGLLANTAVKLRGSAAQTYETTFVQLGRSQSGIGIEGKVANA